MPDLLHEVNIDASPQKVYEAVATQQGLRGWSTADSTAEERGGGRAQFGFMKRAVLFRMTIDELTPAKRVVWTCQGDHDEWKGTTLTWDIVPDGRGHPPIPSRQLADGEPLLRQLQLHVGRADVPVEGLRRGEESPAARTE